MSVMDCGVCGATQITGKYSVIREVCKPPGSFSAAWRGMQTAWWWYGEGRRSWRMMYEKLFYRTRDEHGWTSDIYEIHPGHEAFAASEITRLDWRPCEDQTWLTIYPPSKLWPCTASP